MERWRSRDHPLTGRRRRSGTAPSGRLAFHNNSDREIIQVIFAPSAASYTNLTDYDAQSQQYPPPTAANKPAPAILDVSLAAHDTQVLRFRTCTTTPAPDDPTISSGPSCRQESSGDGRPGTLAPAASA
jgi:hypothetical protein